MMRRLDSETRGTGRRLCRRGPGGAFTLIELMVVISIIALTAALVLPTVARIFSASADEQARSMLGAMLAGVRATAIENACYTAVHVQMGKDGRCWAVALIGEGQGADTVFVLMEGSAPRQMPGSMAFGEISADFVEDVSGTDLDGYKDLSDDDLENFTSFTVAFGPDGAAVKQIGGESLKLQDSTTLFGDTEEAVWETCPDDEDGVRAVTYFPYPHLEGLPPTDGGDPDIVTRTKYLDENGQFICLSCLTGRLMEAQ